MKKKYFLLLIPVAWMTMQYVLSAMTPTQLGIGVHFPGMDKIAHVIIYFGLVMCFFPLGCMFYSPSEWLPFACGTACMFAVADEFHQHFVPGRAVELLDLVADGTGIFLAAIVCRWDWPARIWRRLVPGVETPEVKQS